MRWGNFKIRTKLTLMVIIMVLLTLAVSAGQTYLAGQKILRVASEESMRLAYNDLDHTVNQVKSMVEMEESAMRHEANANLNVVLGRLKSRGEITFSPETVVWEAFNPSNNQATQVSLPKMLVGEAWLGQNRDVKTESPIVDEVAKIIGGTVTIFQRMNEAGDMIRVCTNVETANGSRAVGTYLPAIDSDGSPNQAVNAVLKGQRYVGRVKAANSWRYVADEPIYDGAHKIVGMIYVELDKERVNLLRQKIIAIKIGESGYVYVLDGKGNYVISKNGERDGENILDDQDAEGKFPIKEIIPKALALASGAIGEHTYNWLNKGDVKARKKIVRLAYFEPWDWIIGVGAYEDEFLAAERKISSEWQRAMIQMAVLFMVVTLAVLPFVWYVVAGSITKSLSVSVALAQAIAQGELREQVEVKGEDEIGQLGRALNHMVDNLKSIIVRINSSAASVASAAEEISMASDQITKGAQSQASAADETGSSMEEMAAQIQMVANNANSLAANVDETSTSIQQMGTTGAAVARNAEAMAANVSETSSSIEQMIVTIEKTVKNVQEADVLSRRSSEDAKAGGESVMKTVEGMKNISEVMSGISGVIQNLGQRSEAIGGIVEVIEEIADQTNLLALNAAIEAARAGDAGRGFAVVADEVRKLAERSIKATKEIGDVIKQVQKETAEAVKVTEEGARNSKAGISLADQAGGAIGRIVESVNATSKIMQDISRASTEQSTAAKNVIAAVEEMNKLTQSVTQSTREQAAGIGQVVKASESMAQMTEQVKNATAEQKKGGDNVVKAVENINDIAKSNLAAVGQLAKSAKDLASQSEGLQGLVAEFKVA
jgi:methyl-accepting chemotaxis protein